MQAYSHQQQFRAALACTARSHPLSHQAAPQTSDTPINFSSYQQHSQPNSRPDTYSMAQNPYLHQGYATSAAMVPQATAAVSHPQPNALVSAGGRGTRKLCPKITGGIISQPGVASPYIPGPPVQPNIFLQSGAEQPTHVVGSQRRRGILPSAPGRPTAQPAGTDAKKIIIPDQDADGKFPCPHCTKTYLHAKHLKRHLLRHTGDRPYVCVLCKDNFSRSDILKRHFQKCSIRRGNPTGVNHLGVTPPKFNQGMLHGLGGNMAYVATNDLIYYDSQSSQQPSADMSILNIHQQQ